MHVRSDISTSSILIIFPTSQGEAIGKRAGALADFSLLICHSWETYRFKQKCFGADFHSTHEGYDCALGSVLMPFHIPNPGMTLLQLLSLHYRLIKEKMM